MSQLSEEIIEQIKDSVDIVEFISNFVTLNRSGSTYKGCCPFHSEKTPSFVVNREKQYYKCFGCGEGGDVIKFLMKIENLNFMDALQKLAKESGVDLSRYEENPKTKEKIQKKRKIYDLNIEAARFFLTQLWNNKDAIQYLKNRGLENKIIKNFGIGYAKMDWNNLRKAMNEKGFKDDELLSSGLISKNDRGYRDRFVDRIIFPIFDYKGNVIGFGGRTTKNINPKYLNSPETEAFNKRFHLYGLNFAKNQIVDKGALLVEGYMDVISLHQRGINFAVASLGTALTLEQAKLLKKFNTNVILAYDSDDAGIKATIRAIDILNEVGMNIKILNLKPFKDPDELIVKSGIKEFEKRIDQSITHVDFKIEVLRSKFNLNDQNQNLLYIKKVAQILKQIKSPVEIEIYLKKYSKILNISIESLGKEIYGKYFSPKQFKKNSEKREYEVPLIQNEEKDFEMQILSLIRNEDFALEYAIENLSMDYFKTDFKRNIFHNLVEKKQLKQDEIHFIEKEENFEKKEKNVVLKILKDFKIYALKEKRKNLNEKIYALQNADLREVEEELESTLREIIKINELINKLN